MEAQMLLKELQNLANADDARAMKAYMRGRFEFLGVKTPARRKAAKAFFKKHGGADIDWRFVRQAWEHPFREMQYAALDYLETRKNLLRPGDLPQLKKLAQSKSWWDIKAPGDFGHGAHKAVFVLAHDLDGKGHGKLQRAFGTGRRVFCRHFWQGQGRKQGATKTGAKKRGQNGLNPFE